ncbi:MAG: winged helix-turn-helix transcriptional regulator [Candidatus Hydrothermarchaeaceae archaeon]|jgi:predicted transcriptional regulator
MLSNLINEVELLKRHVLILKLVRKNEPIGILKLSELTGIPQHKVRYSLRILEQRGVIKPSSKGAVSTKKAARALDSLSGELRNISKKLNEI